MKKSRFSEEQITGILKHLAAKLGKSTYGNYLRQLLQDTKY